MPAFTPIYGFRYPLGTDPVPVMPSDMESLAEQFEQEFNRTIGYTKIIPSSTGHTNITFDADGNGTPSTGVTSLTVNNVFTTAYDSFIVQWLGARAAASSQCDLRLNGLTGLGYYGGWIGGQANLTTVFGGVFDNSLAMLTTAIIGATTDSVIVIQLDSPAQSGVQTTIRSWRHGYDNQAGFLRTRNTGFHSSTTAVTGFNLTSISNLTVAGRLCIYGVTL